MDPGMLEKFDPTSSNQRDEPRPLQRAQENPAQTRKKTTKKWIGWLILSIFVTMIFSVYPVYISLVSHGWQSPMQVKAIYF